MVRVDVENVEAVLEPPGILKVSFPIIQVLDRATGKLVRFASEFSPSLTTSFTYHFVFHAVAQESQRNQEGENCRIGQEGSQEQ